MMTPSPVFASLALPALLVLAGCASSPAEAPAARIETRTETCKVTSEAGQPLPFASVGGVGVVMTIRAKVECLVASLAEIAILIGHHQVELVSHALISL